MKTPASMIALLKMTTETLAIPWIGATEERVVVAMKILLGIAILVLVTGCMTSMHRPVAFSKEALVDCPDWAVPVEVDGRFYCVDRGAFEDPD